MKKIERFTLDQDFMCQVKLLTDEEAGKLIKYILEYANGSIPQIDDRVIYICFITAKIQIDNQQRPYGENHWNWKNGASTENHKIRNGSGIKNWRKEVFKRDKYTCQHCNQKGGKLNAHHIKPFALYPDLRTVLRNGLTLCRVCHIEVHKKKSI